MTDSMAGNCDVGVAGLDTAGRNVALRMADHLLKVAACEPRPQMREALLGDSAARGVSLAASLAEMAGRLRCPRAVVLFGGDRDAMIDELAPCLERGDILIDAGISYFKDTARRERWLAGRGLQFASWAIAGGGEGEREGAAILAGGGLEVCAHARRLLEAAAARSAHTGSAAAAHFAGMVHAGIEYGLMQLLSETFDLLQRTLMLSDDEMCDPSGPWHIGVLNGYLMEVSPAYRQPERWMEERLAAARQSDLAQWIARSGRELEVPMPTIDAALGMREGSAAEEQRALAATPSRRPAGRFGHDAESVLDELHEALHAAMIITYAQGFALLRAGADIHGFAFDMGEMVRVWQGSGAMRTSLLGEIGAALRSAPHLPNLLFDDDFSEKVMSCQEYLRHAVCRASELDTIVPALLASLDYLDSQRAAWLPVNLIQARPSELGAAYVLPRSFPSVPTNWSAV